ncbi:MAG: alpha/beta fold hydrolase, partial [Caldithrix sp.]|nr:alpha/beta fold hydrolase [Caldithrix sp.]
MHEKNTADTIFMIHAMCGGEWCWEHYIPFFEEKGYRCIATRLRHHNRRLINNPPSELARTGLLDYAADLEQEIMQLNKKPILMGHSLGGLLAQILASRGLGKALVLLAPAWPAGIVAIRPSVLKSFWSIMTTWKFW